MVKILINTTATILNLDVGISVPASGQATLQPLDYLEAADSDELVELIGDGTLIINDGNENLTKAQGMALIQSGFRKTDFDDNLLASDRLKVDVVGSLSDGKSKVSSNDTTSDFLENKILIGSNKLIKNVNNEGNAEELQLDVDPSNIDTTDLNNNAGFITSGQAPVQPADIANFETSAQLNTRDASNRNRSNHTGTQLSSTISDLTTAIQAAETVTNLSISSNILTYVNEAGTSQNIDLSTYLDDTNLARIVNGTLNSSTGVVTFTRDDSSTFTIDMSALLDNQIASEVPFTATGNTTSTNVQSAIVELQTEIDVNTPKVSADGSINTHSDVDITTTPPTAGDTLSWNGTNFVPNSVDNGFTVFGIWAEESGGLTNNSRQWSFGNGATGNINIVLPIDAELFAVSFDAENGGAATCIMDVYRDDISTFTTKAFTLKDFETITTPIQFTAGQCVGFRTNTETGTISDARVCAWFRVPTSSISSGAINDLLDVSITSIANGEALVWNGSNFTNQSVALSSSLATVATTGDYNDLANKPLLGTAADNAETDFATAAQGLLADSGIQPSDNISTLTNDSGYVDAAGAAAAAPVQLTDIANFETTTELNIRDNDNRNRSNHTGTQTVSTISDFSTGVQSAETNTTLSFNNTTKVLSYVNEAGTTTNVDLTQFLDDTNLARIVSGTLNSSTGVATFTRDDSTTFTIDMSSLNDQAFIISAINTHEVTINNHDDVDTSTEAPTTGARLRWNGTDWTPSKDFKDFARRTDGLVNQTITEFTYLTLTTTVPEAGNYKISWSYNWSLNTTGSDIIIRVLQGATELLNHREEPQDSAGAGIILPNTTGGTTNTGTDQRRNEAGFDIVSLAAGSNIFTLTLNSSVANTEAALYKACLTLEKWEL